MHVRLDRVYYWEKLGCLDVHIVNGVKSVRKDLADEITKLWKESCTPSEAARELGIKERGGGINNLIKNNVLVRVFPFGDKTLIGQGRVALSSIPQAKRYVAETEERMRRIHNRNRGLSWGHKFNAETASNAARMKAVQRGKQRQQEQIDRLLVLYVPANTDESGIIGSRKLVTPESAADFLGVPIRRLLNLGIRGEYINGTFLPYAHALEVYKRKQKKVL